MAFMFVPLTVVFENIAPSWLKTLTPIQSVGAPYLFCDHGRGGAGDHRWRCLVDEKPAAGKADRVSQT